MRWVICAAVALFLAPSAHAQDFDGTLRGPESVGPARFTKWSGVYFGGQAGYGGGQGDFSNATNGLLAYALRETELEAVANPSSWSLLGNSNSTVTSYGAFVGYNTQWQDLVLGGEIDYSRVNMTFTAPSTPIQGLTYYAQTLGGDQETEYQTTANATASLHLIDYASLRARAGWIFGDNFLPYGFAGFVVGRGQARESVGIGGEEITTQYNGTYTPLPVLALCPYPTNGYVAAVPQSCQTFGTENATGGNVSYLYGFDAGVGIDVALTPNMFLRGEFEYVHLFPINDITVDIAQARIGAGFKF